jgi:ABC-2 type transport system permease protein
VKRSMRWLAASWGASLRGAMEYRTSFAVQALFMLANNFLFLGFWAIFFQRVPSVAGWTLADVALCYGMAATAFGLAAVFAGGVFELAPAIARGGLDTWLLRPRPVLLQAVAGRMRLSGFGDLVTGPILLILAGHATPARIAVFVAGSVIGALVFAAFVLACHAAAFWFGRAEELSLLGVNAILSFALYPPGLFTGPSRLLLFTVLPAGLMSWLPAELVLRPDAGGAARLLLGA